jgi:hypothetical protein
MTLKKGVVIGLAILAFAVLARIIADVFDISRNEPVYELVILGIFGFAWWRWWSRLS